MSATVRRGEVRRLSGLGLYDAAPSPPGASGPLLCSLPAAVAAWKAGGENARQSGREVCCLVHRPEAAPRLRHRAGDPVHSACDEEVFLPWQPSYGAKSPARIGMAVRIGDR